MQEITFEDGHKTREFFLARDPQALIQKHGDAMEKIGVKEIRQTIVRDSDPCPCGSGMKFGRCRCRKRLNQGPFVVGGPSDPSPAKQLADAAGAIATAGDRLLDAGPRDIVGEGFAPEPPRNGPGLLEVGHNERGEVVVNLPRDMTGHIVFTPAQARGLAETLARRANVIDPHNGIPPKLASSDDVPAAVVDAMGKTIAEMSDAELTDYFQHLAPSLEYALPPGANADGRVNYVLVLLEPPDVVAHISNCNHLEKVRILREVADRIESAAKGDAGPKAN